MTRQELREKIDSLLEDNWTEDPMGGTMTLAEGKAEAMHLIDEYCKSLKEEDNASDS